jgi:radical SAM superfamily enzyme YgiQ (UPF0313 family)
MLKVALFSPIIPNYSVPIVFSELSQLYSQAVAKLTIEESLRRSLNIKRPPVSKYIVSEGLLSIASVLINHGHLVEYFEEQYLIDIFKIDETLRRIAMDFDVCGISVSTPAFPHVSDLIKRLKRIRSDLIIVLGGPHVTFCDSEALFSGTDFVIRHDGENAMADLIDCLEKSGDLLGISGLSFLKKGKVIRISSKKTDISLLPMPAYDLVPKEMRPHSSVSVLTSRGCPWSCSFCAEKALFPKIQYFTNEQVLAKVQKVSEVFPFNFVMLFDSTFTHPKKRMAGLVEELGAKFPKMYFGCNARADTITPDMVKNLSMAHFTDILIGGESGSELVLSSVNKGISPKHTLNALKIIDDKIPFSLVTFVIGLPGDSMQTIHATVEHISTLFRKTKVFKINTRMFVPYPGTPVFEHPERFGIRLLEKNPVEFVRYHFPSVVETKDLSAFEIWGLFLESYFFCTMELVRRANLEELAERTLRGTQMVDMIYSNTKPF